MALPYLVKHIYNNGSDEVIRRGKKIHSLGGVELLEHEELLGNVTFRVKDDNFTTYYKVHITHFKDPKTVSLRCSCPFNLREICRHKAAALFTLQELLDRNMLGERELVYDQRHTTIKMKQIDIKMLRMLSSPDTYSLAEEFLRTTKATIKSAKDEQVLAEVGVQTQTYKVVLQKNEERNFDTSCTCGSETKHPLCMHKIIVALQLYHKHGPNYFESIRNWDSVKNKLLSIYGYSLQDNIKGKFEFTYTDGKPFLRVLDSSIKKINISGPSTEQKPFVFGESVNGEGEKGEGNGIVLPETVKKVSLKLGVVLVFGQQPYPGISIDAIQGEANEEMTAFVGKAEKLDLNKFINIDVFSEDDKWTLQQVRKFLQAELNKYLSRNSPFSGAWDNVTSKSTEAFPEETRNLIHEYLHPKYQKLFIDLASSSFTFYLPTKKTFTTANLRLAKFETTPIFPKFVLSSTKSGYEMECLVNLPDRDVNVSMNDCDTDLVFQQGNRFYNWARHEDIILVQKFLPKGKKTFDQSKWAKNLLEFILPLAKEYDVNFDRLEQEEQLDVVPDLKITVREKGDFLTFQPTFSYKGVDVKDAEKDRIILPSGDKLLIIRRNLELEQKALDRIEELNHNFIHPYDSEVLALKGSEVLKNNWFFLFVDTAKEMGAPILGMEDLRNYRFNTERPDTKIFISSNTDWFDAKIEVCFGDQLVTIDDIKTALAAKQQYVLLADGSLGILPDEWIRRYALLFRVGEGKQNVMRLSKYHFSVIEDMFTEKNENNEEELKLQLEEKYSKIKENHTIKEVDAPAHLAPILRPYQLSGFRWLNYLREVQWGGILADDMGLGKTIQTLSFVNYLKETQERLLCLVVCPTTLMYNWQNEIQKFTPTVTFLVHHGGSRTKNKLLEEDVNVIITTYGTLRSDIKLFTSLTFDYVILDESQAIKNPSSKVTKAACLLNAKNRLCLSGTPLQNNTFDIYAQMNFLNPGMLGSVEFFKQEFALPIDKMGEKLQKEHLRKLLYPFILRRTKEQVAKDLPEKQEMVLYCEMGEEQRKIYEDFRRDFKDKILGVVDTQGIQRSQLTILQGLMKLRQICDSPAIMNEVDKYPNESVKLEELAREITENISNHKALVFSQFLGMLALIREKLRELGVNHEYFDGSTSAVERERAIQNFQHNDDCRVFLISLKAGGVGLNLTAADYVYIVDPWWNPAVEQQAIDRTHRIGQTKNVFAYRMICTDTVEDKIQKLQERKKSLARDLITDDETFVKSLTREDVEYLFN